MMFEYYNNNPLGIHEEDCVTRAITYATNQDYNTIARQLYGVSLLYGCEKLCPCCYIHLLENFYQFEQLKGFKGMTIEEFSMYNPIGIYLIRVNGHLTILDNGIIYDLFDCSQEIVDIVWKIY